MKAEIIIRKWRRVDLKLAFDGDLHVLSWRRGLFADQVYFDDRRVAQSEGVFSRETTFGLEMRKEDGSTIRMLLSVDPGADEADVSGDMRPQGVRLETGEETLVAFGSLAPNASEAGDAEFSDPFERASKALGLS